MIDISFSRDIFHILLSSLIYIVQQKYEIRDSWPNLCPCMCEKYAGRTQKWLWWWRCDDDTDGITTTDLQYKLFSHRHCDKNKTRCFTMSTHEYNKKIAVSYCWTLEYGNGTQYNDMKRKKEIIMRDGVNVLTFSMFRIAL